MSTRVRFTPTSRMPILPRMALSGTSIMLPVARSEPAMSTSTRPRVNAAPMNSVGSVPHVFGSRPEETVIATSAPNAMYAPARNALTSTRFHVRWVFFAPVSTATWAISCGSRADKPAPPGIGTGEYGCPSGPWLAERRDARAPFDPDRLRHDDSGHVWATRPEVRH